MWLNVAIGLLIPLLATIIYSLFEDWTGIVPHGFTLANYQKIFTDPAFLTAMYQTVLICIIPIVITVVVVLLALFVITVYFPRLEKYVQILSMIPYTIQGVILSVSILVLYAKNNTVLGSRMVMLIGAYCIIILPHIYNGIRNGMPSVFVELFRRVSEGLADLGF